ncbi:MAG: SelB C-terminal domain-containing protein, partial [Bryobacterales bacterium]|nr:SelB C-terminal domain-containing protein [Bryobacterales bacterium]
LRLATHKLSLQSDEDAASEKMEALFRTGGLAVPAINDVLKEAGVDAARARTLLQILLRRGSLVRVSADLIFHSTAITRLKEVLAARRGQRFGVAEFKQWTGVSRKYAIPLLEYLDRERLTRREGDQRLVL